MNTYRVTDRDGNVHDRSASDMRALLMVWRIVEGKPEPVKIEEL